MRSSVFTSKLIKAGTIALAGLLIGLSAYLVSSKIEVLATGWGHDQDDCNQVTTYEVDEDYESHLTFYESGNRVDIDFNGGNDDRNQVIITAGTNYILTAVRYDTETNNTNWINFLVSNPTTTINLAGTSSSTRIDKVEVKVKKVCATPTPSPTPSPTPTATPTPTPSPTPTEPDRECDEGYHYNQEQASCDPDQEQEFSPTPTTEPTPSPTPEDPGIGGPGPASAPVCTDTKPGTPTLLSATFIGASSINIKWNQVNGADNYSIFYGPSSGNYLYGVPATGNTDNFTVNGLANGCFILRAVNGCAPSDPSNEVCTGAIGGQVLGASTMAGTGVVEEAIFNSILVLGSAFSFLGIRKIVTSKLQ